MKQDNKDKNFESKYNNTLKLVSPEKKGNDLILSVDIDLQNKVEQILKEEKCIYDTIIML